MADVLKGRNLLGKASGGLSAEELKAARHADRLARAREPLFAPQDGGGGAKKKKKAAADEQREGTADKCLICQYEYKEGERLRTLPCIHSYHADCIDPWLLRNRTCPVCQRSILEDGR